MPPRAKKAAKVATPAALPLDGCVVAFRGSFPGSNQAALIEQATRLGARAPKSLTKDVTHLITTEACADEPSSKVHDARTRGVHVVSIDWMLDSESSNSRQPEAQYYFDSDGNDDGNDDGTTPASVSTQSAPIATKKRQASPSLPDSSPEPKHQSKKTKLGAAEDDVIPVLGKEQIAKSWDVQVPVDEECSLSGYGVHIDEDSVIWDASLNQTNAGKNNNKFYKIQLLINAANNCCTWTRWGRVGEPGQSSILGNGSLADAKAQFQKKFKDKTGLTWDNRTENPRPNKYVFLEKCYQPDSDDDDDIKPAGDANGKDAMEVRKPPACTLDLQVQNLMELIFNQKYFAAAMSDLNYDVDKLPLGRLSKATIMRGFQALKGLSDLINSPATMGSPDDLSNLYYSLIPHNFGRNRPPVINTQATVKREIELLENLADMKDAANILKGEVEARSSIHPLDRQYLGLGMEEMTPLDPSSVEFQSLGDYLMNTRGHTHSANYNIEAIFRIERQGEKERFITCEKSDRRLLWHGSRVTNFGGILSQGLRIAPPEAPSTGYMFGKGAYLADISTKSANYCNSHTSDGTALLLLCEAELGDPMQELTNADYNAGEKAKAKGVLSTWGKGTTGPSAWKDASCAHYSLAGVKMPDTSCGRPGPTGVNGACLQYNEYICYDVAQIKLRYLFRVKM